MEESGDVCNSIRVVWSQQRQGQSRRKTGGGQRWSTDVIHVMSKHPA